MNIRNLQSGASPLTTRKAGSATDAQSSASGASSEKSDAVSKPQAQDRVELSAAARVQTSEAKGEELEQARNALEALPPLSPERRETILRRVQEGYYSQPDIMGIIAERLHADITGIEPKG